MIAFGVSGFLLEAFCPDPKSARFADSVNFQADYAAATADAHYLWLVFFFIGLISALALIIYARYVNKIDRAKGIIQ